MMRADLYMLCLTGNRFATLTAPTLDHLIHGAADLFGDQVEHVLPAIYPIDGVITGEELRRIEAAREAAIQSAYAAHRAARAA